MHRLLTTPVICSFTASLFIFGCDTAASDTIDGLGSADSGDTTPAADTGPISSMDSGPAPQDALPPRPDVRPPRMDSGQPPVGMACGDLAMCCPNLPEAQQAACDRIAAAGNENVCQATLRTAGERCRPQDGGTPGMDGGRPPPPDGGPPPRPDATMGNQSCTDLAACCAGLPNRQRRQCENVSMRNNGRDCDRLLMTLGGRCAPADAGPGPGDAGPGPGGDGGAPATGCDRLALCCPMVPMQGQMTCRNAVAAGVDRACDRLLMQIQGRQICLGI